MNSGKASIRKRMKRTRLRKPARGQGEDSCPRDPVFSGSCGGEYAPHYSECKHAPRKGLGALSSGSFSNPETITFHVPAPVPIQIDGSLPSLSNTHSRRRGWMKQKRAALYVRVSSGEQHTEMQERALREYVHRRSWLLHKIYRDKCTGATANR